MVRKGPAELVQPCFPRCVCLLFLGGAPAALAELIRYSRFGDGYQLAAGVSTVGGRSGGQLTSLSGAVHHLEENCAAAVSFL